MCEPSARGSTDECRRARIQRQGTKRRERARRLRAKRYSYAAVPSNPAAHTCLPATTTTPALRGQRRHRVGDATSHGWSVLYLVNVDRVLGLLPDIATLHLSIDIANLHLTIDALDRPLDHHALLLARHAPPNNLHLHEGSHGDRACVQAAPPPYRALHFKHETGHRAARRDRGGSGQAAGAAMRGSRSPA